MSVSGILLATLRSWKVLIPALIVTVGLAVLTFRSEEPSFQADFAISVAPSSTYASALDNNAGGSFGVNPFRTAGGAGVLAALLQQALTGEALEAKAVSAGPGLGVQPSSGSLDDIDLTITYDDLTRPAYLTGTVTVDSADAVGVAIADVTAFSNTYLQELQASAGASELSTYVAVLATPNPAAEEIYPNRVRQTAGVIGAGLLASVLLCVAVDGFKSRRNVKHAS